MEFIKLNINFKTYLFNLLLKEFIKIYILSLNLIIKVEFIIKFIYIFFGLI